MKKKLIIVLAIAISLLLAVVFIEPVYNWVMNNVGRWHIIVLHFPIGLLACAWLMEVLVRLNKANFDQASIRFVIVLGVLSALFASVSGWILKSQGGYEPELVQWHQWLGIVTTACAIVTYVLARSDRRKLYFGIFSIQLILLIVTGHYGGSLTHGEGFLTENLTNTSANTAVVGEFVAYEDATVWDNVVKPIIDASCVSCHNPSKKKGGLMLTDSVAIMKGGNRGSIFESSNEANLCAVINLELEEELHMPPKGKVQLTDQEREILCWWYTAGGVYSVKVDNSNMSEEMKLRLKEQFSKDPIDLLGIEKPDDEVLAMAIENGVRIQSNGPESSWISVNFSDKEVKASDFNQLEDLLPNITQLDLGNTQLDDDIIDWVVECKQLQNLKLDHCEVSKNHLEVLSELEYLEELNLYGATVEKDGVAVFSEMKALKKLFLWNSSFSESEIKKIKRLNKGVDVIFDDPGKGFPKQKIAPPYTTTEQILLSKGDAIPLANVFPTAKIYFTTDGAEPTESSELLTKKSVLKKTSRIKARAFLEGWEPSDIFESSYVVSPDLGYSIVRKTAPDEQYSGASEQELSDNKFGTAAISDEKWLGYFGKDMQIVIDLEEVKSINGIAIHSLEDVRSWVFFPSEIKVEAGKSIGSMKQVKTTEFNRTDGIRSARMDLFLIDSKFEARYIKITVKSYGKLPEWHESPGQPSWLFLDELVIY
ncbi:MAG: chitobiase/beta-hexosaminidase C-terminal domain-containing protein [Crocinitomicaceae bacterium]